MDSTRKLIARKMFRLRIYEAKGLEYQRLFQAVMKYRTPGFIPVRPWGSQGDRGNDGYCPDSGTYFQVFAPENPEAARIPTTAADKAASDFEKLLDHWDRDTPIQKYRFVFNDEYRGSPAPLENAMAEIRTIHHINASVFLSKDLEDEALALEADQLLDIIQAPIPVTGPFANVDFSVLREVIKHVLEFEKGCSSSPLLRAPDFDKKISFNGLTPSVAALLTAGSYQNEAVRDYFSRNSTFARQQVRDHLAALYLETRSRLQPVVASKKHLGDLIFFDLLQEITPKADRKDQSVTVAAQNAAIIVMAFYFEACDIFEDPDATT